MRIRESQVFAGSSPQFKNIYILTSVENDVNLIIFLPKQAGQINEDTMHDNIKNGLKALVEEKRYEAGEVKVWLP